MKTNVYPVGLRNFIKSLLVCISCWLVPSVAKADTPIPTGIVTNYNPATQRLTVNVNWFWSTTSSSKHVGAAVFADLNGDGITPTIFDNPATYTSGGNPFPAGLQPRDEFLGQIALSNINGTATSSFYPSGDRTDNGIASTVPGVTPSTPRMLLPYGMNPQSVVNASGNDNGSFTLTYDGVTVSPTRICVILYDPHSPFKATGGHSVVSAGPDHNTDNSFEEGNSAGTVSCQTLTSLNCAQNKTEAACQTQTAINASYNAWLNSVTASGCNGTLTNNSTGAPSASGGSKTVTWTYTQNSCPNQAAVTTCSATFTVLACNNNNGSIGDRVWQDTDGDGLQDVTETSGVAGITVQLKNSVGTVIASTTTDASGNYSFNNLPAGTYSLQFPTSVGGAGLSPAFVGPNRDLDSDPSQTTGQTPQFTLTTNQVLTNVDAGYTVNCNCTNSQPNVLVNGSFQNGITGWSTSGGTLTAGTGYQMCGSQNGSLTQSSGTARTSQDITIAAGSTVTFSAYAGTTAAGLNCTPKLSLIYLNAANQVISQFDANVTYNVGSSNTLASYSINGGIAPAGTVKVRVEASTSCSTLYLDALCLIVVPPTGITNPDFNSTYVNIHVQGNVSTNDKMPVGTTYGTSPSLVSSPAGSIKTLIMNSNGTYDFVANMPGVYTYNVPVCQPGQAAPCPTTPLVITVLNSNVFTNPPVANVDIATTPVNTPVTLNTLANDAAGNPGNSLVPSSVTIMVNPLNGSVSVDPATGNTTYTPNLNFVGNDTLTYRVCDNQAPAQCATAKQVIIVRANGQPNTTVAADDYNITAINTPASGNVATNDSDPEGHAQIVANQNTTIAGKGTLVLLSNGNYTFTPVNGFSGPVDFPYTICDNGTPQACASATLHILVRPEAPVSNPDFNSTFVNVIVTGNVNTNDKVPGGTLYCTSPTLVSSPAGSVITLIMNSNGSYSFVANMPGVYTYNVCYCVPGAVAPCPTTPLVITVLNHLVVSNPPVANVDIATTNLNTAVTLNTLANDAAGNLGNSLVPSSVTITANPLNGTVTVNPANGNTTYTPNAGFTGSDTLTYQVCDNQSPAKCATAKQVIIVKPAGAPNTTVAADDYKITQINTSASGNVKTNDSDPEGNTQTVIAQPSTTVVGKGTLVLASDGSYTFTPVANFTGPVDFAYTTCDNGVPSACASATLHILVRPAAPMTNPDFNSTFVNVHVSGDVRTNDFVPAGTTYGTSPTLTSSPAGSTATLVMGATGVYDFVADMVGVYRYAVPVCVPGQVAPCPTTELTITVLAPLVNNNGPVANVDIASTNMNQPVILKTLANDAAGSPTTALVPSSVTVTVLPLHGTATPNPVNGDITYAPAAGFVGFDTLTYQVCDNQAPAKCATAKQIIWVKGPGMTNTTTAADDYKITAINTMATGNVKTNDFDAEGNFQTVTAGTFTAIGKGSLVLAADGSYTFTPVLNYTGPVDFVYTTCDNGVPVACASATLHILVKPASPAPDLSPNITAIPNIMHGTTNFNVTVKVQELLGNPTDGSTILVRIPRDPRVTFTYNNGLTTVGFTPVNNSVWTYDGSDPIFHLFRTNIIIPGNGSSTFGFQATFTPGQTQGKYTLSSSLNSGSGGEIITNNNQDAEVIDYFIN